MGVKKIIKKILLTLAKKRALYNYSNAVPATVDWFIGTEIKYGGIVTNVKRNKVSPQDPRTQQQLDTGGMVGGDRMLHHGYARKYSEYLLPYAEKAEPVVLVEFGILKGTGLATWCELFKNGRIIGLDIDLGHINSNMDNLKALGAFSENSPELHEIDQFQDNTEYLGGLLGGQKINICIDDGFHSNESILNTLRCVMPHLAEQFVYFAEDNRNVHLEIRAAYPDLRVDSDGALTIITRD